MLMLMLIRGGYAAPRGATSIGCRTPGRSGRRPPGLDSDKGPPVPAMCLAPKFPGWIESLASGILLRRRFHLGFQR
jgi:hypothetical protein